MTSPLQQRLALQPAGTDRFVGDPAARRSHVYGGLLVAQAQTAAELTMGACTDQRCHSVHASFLRAGRPGLPLLHEVERVRDGTSFSSRRVLVTQAGEPVLIATVGFHVSEECPHYEAADPAVAAAPSPDGLGPGRYDSEVFDCRDVEPSAGPPHERRMWFRVRGEVGDDPVLHRRGVVYASDHGPTRSVRQPHAGHPGVEDRMSVSLDHSIWLHRPARIDQWLLSTLTPVSTGGGRGLTLGTIRTAAGELVATVAQEVLLRLPGPEPDAG